MPSWGRVRTRYWLTTLRRRGLFHICLWTRHFRHRALWCKLKKSDWLATERVAAVRRVPTFMAISVRSCLATAVIARPEKLSNHRRGPLPFVSLLLQQIHPTVSIIANRCYNFAKWRMDPNSKLALSHSARRALATSWKVYTPLLTSGQQYTQGIFQARSS